MRVGLLLLTFGFANGSVRLDPLVDTEQGLIRGLRSEDGNYSMFLGIPYAKVNESNPFGASIPHTKFEEVFEAFDDSAICPQEDEFTKNVAGTLNCLNLNIFVPNNASSKNKLPVLVWIHGGGFNNGFGNRYLYGPKYLIRHDVIFVTLNYRVRTYGFMCLEIPEVPGNQGLKDQLTALRWIKKNIAFFGGNDNKITIMGGSAGSASVEYQLYSEHENLFNQVIMQSGSLFGSWFKTESETTSPLMIAEHLGFQSDDLSQALKFLKNTNEKVVIAATTELDIRYRACIEKEFDGVESILTKHPESLDVPKAKNTAILAGFNSLEMLFTYANKPATYFENLNIFTEFLESAFNYDDDFKEMEDIVRHFYLGDDDISIEKKFSISDFVSDFRSNYPAIRSLVKLIDNGATNVFQYVFSYSGGRNFIQKRLNITEDGAVHADEIGYLFDLSYEKETPSDEDQLMIDRITTLWTNFVKYGEPTPETTDLLPVKWEPVTKDTFNYLDIDKELSLRKRAYHARMAFWELFYKTNKAKMKGFHGN